MGNPFGPFYSFQTLLLIVCAVAYYRAAEVENASGILWAALSVIVFLITWLLFGWGFVGNLLGQVGLLGGIAAARAVRHSRKPP
jgi:hypothetical protein